MGKHPRFGRAANQTLAIHGSSESKLGECRGDTKRAWVQKAPREAVILSLQLSLLGGEVARLLEDPDLEVLRIVQGGAGLRGRWHYAPTPFSRSLSLLNVWHPMLHDVPKEATPLLSWAAGLSESFLSVAHAARHCRLLAIFLQQPTDLNAPSREGHTILQLVLAHVPMEHHAALLVDMLLGTGKVDLLATSPSIAARNVLGKVAIRESRSRVGDSRHVETSALPDSRRGGILDWIRTRVVDRCIGSEIVHWRTAWAHLAELLPDGLVEPALLLFSHQVFGGPKVLRAVAVRATKLGALEAMRLHGILLAALLDMLILPFLDPIDLNEV